MTVDGFSRWRSLNRDDLPEIAAAKLRHRILEIGDEKMGCVARARTTKRGYAIDKGPARKGKVGALTKRTDDVEARADTAVEEYFCFISNDVLNIPHAVDGSWRAVELTPAVI